MIGVHRKEAKQAVAIHHTTAVTSATAIQLDMSKTAATTTIMAEIHQQVTVQVHQVITRTIVLDQVEELLGYSVIMQVTEEVEIMVRFHLQDIVHQVMKIRKKID